MKKQLEEGFKKIFRSTPEKYFSCGGRFEILGNHTDHNHGKCLAGTCSLSNYAAVKVRNDTKINIYSKGYGPFKLDVFNTKYKEEEKGRSASIIRGIAHYLVERNYKVGGLDIYMDSKVPSGAGVSSSAAFELLVAEIFNQMFNEGKIDRLLLCKAGQYAERHYYGKMCGLLDQIGVGFGGSTYIDFEDIENPKVESLPMDMEGYRFLIINTGGSHAGLDHLYSAIPQDMFNIASYFGKGFLNECNKKEVMKAKNELVKKFGELPYFRAIHFFEECERVSLARECIKNKDFDGLIKLMNKSCESSTNLLCNMMVDKIEGSPLEAIKLINKVAPQNAGIKINGGGFAGSVICLVKSSYYETVIDAASKRYGDNNVFKIDIRPTGPIEM